VKQTIKKNSIRFVYALLMILNANIAGAKDSSETALPYFNLVNFLKSVQYQTNPKLERAWTRLTLRKPEMPSLNDVLSSKGWRLTSLELPTRESSITTISYIALDGREICIRLETTYLPRPSIVHFRGKAFTALPDTNEYISSDGQTLREAALHDPIAEKYEYGILTDPGTMHHFVIIAKSPGKDAIVRRFPVNGSPLSGDLMPTDESLAGRPERKGSLSDEDIQRIWIEYQKSVSASMEEKFFDVTVNDYWEGMQILQRLIRREAALPEISKIKAP
jgi:hypothetical protein